MYKFIYKSRKNSMQNIIQKRFLFTLAWTLTVSQGAMAHKSMLEEIKNGICPDGLEYTCSILAGGCAALPGAMVQAALQNNFSNIPSTLSLGVPIISGTAATYAFYKVHQALEKRTRQAILKQKAYLLEEINTLKENNCLSEKSIANALNQKFADQYAQGGYPSIVTHSYIAELIKQIEWLNPKLTFLEENPINEEIIKILKTLYTNIVSDPNYRTDLKKHQRYKEERYNNQLGTKIKRSAWWTTKKTAQAGLFAAKVSAYVCWDLFKIVLSNITRTIL